MVVRAKERFVWKEKTNGYVTVSLFLVTLAGFFLIPPRIGLPPSWFESSRALMIAGLIVVVDMLIGLRFDARIHAASEARRREELSDTGATYRVTDRQRPDEAEFLVQWRRIDGKPRLVRLESGEPINGATLKGSLVEESSAEK